MMNEECLKLRGAISHANKRNERFIQNCLVRAKRLRNVYICSLRENRISEVVDLAKEIVRNERTSFFLKETEIEQNIEEFCEKYDELDFEYMQLIESAIREELKLEQCEEDSISDDTGLIEEYIEWFEEMDDLDAEDLLLCPFCG